MDPVLIVGIIVFIVIFVKVGPLCLVWGFALIWSINTLFNLGIPYNFTTCFASIIVVVLASGTLSEK